MAHQPDGAAPGPVTGRSVVANRYGIVAASQPLAAAAGVDVLRRGGHAVDAAIATNAAMAVMEPTGCGVGGDLFALVYEAAAGRVHALDASGWAPAGLTRGVLEARGFDEMPADGVHSVTVPGAVAGWAALADRFGRHPLADLLAAAIHHAGVGFPVAPVTAGHWRGSVEGLLGDADAAATFLVDGRAPNPGEPFRNPALARTLTRIAERGRDGFYRGETAEAIVAASDVRGGTLALADLADFEPEWVDPIATVYRGWTVYETPPPSQGIAALLMLDLMERFPMGDFGFHSPDALHVMIEAKKLAYADMIACVGDPRFATTPAPWPDRERAAERARAIDMRRAACDVPPSGQAGLTDRAGGDTIYLAVVDRHGDMVSLIQSNYQGFGSGVVPPGTGFMLQNRGALFTLDPGHPNALEPRKRPLHTIIPAFMEKDGVGIAFGIMGGWNQAQAHAQFVAAIADFGLDVQQALEAGRFTKPTFHGCDVEIESLVPRSTRDRLADRGHLITAHAPRTPTFGYGQAVMAALGIHYGASDPRHDGAAIPEPV